ncbi:uncharacterized protein PG986_006383 [Apiospora aurea]|uniref:Uncharacterized protein n=1 Tax=Apiospora aurea TaxID=335848 RepID=A0ABR1QLT0_9PEZI
MDVDGQRRDRDSSACAVCVCMGAGGFKYGGLLGVLTSQSQTIQATGSPGPRPCRHSLPPHRRTRPPMPCVAWAPDPDPDTPGRNPRHPSLETMEICNRPHHPLVARKVDTSVRLGVCVGIHTRMEHRIRACILSRKGLGAGSCCAANIFGMASCDFSVPSGVDGYPVKRSPNKARAQLTWPQAKASNIWHFPATDPGKWFIRCEASGPPLPAECARARLSVHKGNRDLCMSFSRQTSPFGLLVRHPKDEIRSPRVASLDSSPTPHAFQPLQYVTGDAFLLIGPHRAPSRASRALVMQNPQPKFGHKTY